MTTPYGLRDETFDTNEEKAFWGVFEINVLTHLMIFEQKENPNKCESLCQLYSADITLNND